WVVGWNILAWVGNIRLRRGQTAISIAANRNELYISGMRDVVSGVRLERLALACELGAIVFGLFLLLRHWLMQRRQSHPTGDGACDKPAKEPWSVQCGLATDSEVDVRKVEWPIGDIPSFESISVKDVQNPR